MAALPSLRQLRYLIALAEHLNFTRAAQASFVSQSTLSTGLKELESTLGVQLVERDKQNVALTAVGEEVVARARQVLAAAEDLSDFASDASRPMQGQLRLGVIPTIAPFVLPTVMPALREKFPQLQLALREDLRTRLGWGHVLGLQLLDEVQSRAVLRQAADARGLDLSDEVMDFTLRRFSRDLGSLMQLLDGLDRYALQTQRALTIPLVKSMLENA